MVSGRMGKISVFCSYAREDEAMRATLEKHLAPLRSEKIIDDWYDNRIQPGAKWDDQIERALDSARLIIFIVGPDLISSRYINEVELPRALELERKGQCQIVPVMASQTDWRGSPLKQFQALPRNARPVDTYENESVAFTEIVTGIREVCKRIVDWEQPYKRTQIGEWTHSKQSTTVEGHQPIAVEVVAEVVAKDEKSATVAVDAAGAGEQLKQNLSIDLTTPLDDSMGNIMAQIQQSVPADAEIRIGPSTFEEEILSIGTMRYETIKVSRQLTIGQQNWEQTGIASTWRCIDVPLDGIVKGTYSVPGFSQNIILLGYGHRGSGQNKPSPTASAQPVVGPGRWRMVMSAMGVSTNIDLHLQAGGALQGVQSLMGVSVQLQGQWQYNPANKSLILQLTAYMMGIPASQDMIQMQITEQQGSTFYGADAMGRHFVLNRLG